MDEMNILPDGTQETNIPESSRQKPAQQKKAALQREFARWPSAPSSSAQCPQERFTV